MIIMCYFYNSHRMASSSPEEFALYMQRLTVDSKMGCIIRYG